MGWLTQTDLDNYGPDLIDVSQRAAMNAVAPHLQNLEQQNRELQQRLAIEARRNLDAAVERALPNYRETDRDPRWHRWLLEIDPLTGQPRQALLNSAIASFDANRVIAFFKGFLREAGGTKASQASSAPGAGRARSSGGKPFYTRDQITKLYDQHRRGAYVGREAEWARLEVDIIRAGAEGRIANPVDIAGK
jgi:hypothetical protein